MKLFQLGFFKTLAPRPLDAVNGPLGNRKYGQTHQNRNFLNSNLENY